MGGTGGVDERVRVAGLEVARPLHAFVRDEALPGSGIEEDAFWLGLAGILRDLGPRLRPLLDRRDELQAELDTWHVAHPGPVVDGHGYEAMLREIGYLVEEPADFTITTTGVDTEVASVAGPQLVVPLLNARFAVNAANARWGSLYDALYGSDAVDEDDGRARTPVYNPVRGAEVIRRGTAFLDAHFPLDVGCHADATGYAVVDERLVVRTSRGVASLLDGRQLAGLRGDPTAPDGVLLVHHGLHVEVVIDRRGTIGSQHPAGVHDLVLESALTTIMDLEDSVTAVDVDDKVLGYRNWLRLNAGILTAEMLDRDRSFERRLAQDRFFTAPDGKELVLPGRSLLWIRHVGHLMTTDAVLMDGAEVSEGILDAAVTCLGSLVDLQGRSRMGNSRTGSMYVVKPKMHGPEEVALTDELFARVEELFRLPTGTIKLGIMDEERRTSANLKACVRAAAGRVAFINTGFLDRTADELRTSMLGGPMVRKEDMRGTRWIAAYEDQNVDVGLACGFRGRAQIGKGMWARPDDMAAMLDAKVDHPLSGASCAWVPSPTAATLHALHYHSVDVAAVQESLTGARRTTLADLLAPPLAPSTDWSGDERIAEIENNLQGVLGYVKRWVDDGIGCSKVPDIHGTALMEDRATCRISSQHVANWLRHGIVTVQEVESALLRMARVVDRQQAAPGYVPMGPDYDGHAFRAARDLIFEGLRQPSGYTEPILHRRRRLQKAISNGAPA